MKQSVSNTFLIILVIFSITFETQGQDEPNFHKIRIKDGEFEKVLKSNPHILEGMMDVVEIEGQKYLISIGTSPLAENKTPEKMLSALKYAREVAKKAFSERLNIAISTYKSIETEVNTTTVLNKDGIPEVVERINETFFSFIKTSSNELIRAPEQKEIGWWISEDRTLLYAGIAYPM
jgi:hypothetical protein